MTYSLYNDKNQYNSVLAWKQKGKVIYNQTIFCTRGCHSSGEVVELGRLLMDSPCMCDISELRLVP